MHAQSQRWDPSRQCMAWYGFNWHTSYAIPPLWAHLRDVCWWQRLLCASEVQRTLVYITLQCLMGCHSSSRSVLFYGYSIRPNGHIKIEIFKSVHVASLFIQDDDIKMTYTLHHFYDHKTKKCPQIKCSFRCTVYYTIWNPYNPAEKSAIKPEN